jgi:ankyrin repeat protein
MESNSTTVIMKDACGLCSTFMESEEVVKTNNVKTVLLTEADDIVQVESIVGSPSKLGSIVEDVKEETDQDGEEKKTEPEEIVEDAVQRDPEPMEVPTQTATAPDIDIPIAETAIGPVVEVIVVKDETLECDFDKNPSDLYMCLMHKDWSNSIRRCVQHPEEAKTWIYRKENTGILRWKLLPIHAAIIFNAPVPVIDTLLHAYAEGAGCKDDQGMVPLHLAIRMNSDHTVVENLVAAQPESVKAQDRKGRTPRALAEKQASCPQKLLVIQTLENVDSLPRPSPAIATEVANHEGLTKESGIESTPVVAVRLPKEETPTEVPAASSTATAVKDAFADAEAVKHSFTLQLEKLTRDSAAIQNHLKAQIEALEKEARKDKETIAALEETVQSAQESESDLRNQLSEIALKVHTVTNEKTQLEDANRAVIVNLVSQVGDLQTKLTDMTNEREVTAKVLADLEENTKQEMAQKKVRVVELERQLGQVSFLKKEADEELSKAESTIVLQKGQISLMKEDISKLQLKLTETETKLEEVTVSEQELAWQNHALSVTGQMYAKNGQTDPVAKSEQIKALEKEREDLRETVNKLSVKLYKVVGFLDEMVQEQEAIITDTMARDNELVPVSGPGGSTEFNTSEFSNSEERIKLLSNVSGMKEQIIGVIDSVIEGMPQQLDEDVVDQVCTTLKSNQPVVLP